MRYGITTASYLIDGKGLLTLNDNIFRVFNADELTIFKGEPLCIIGSNEYLTSCNRPNTLHGLAVCSSDSQRTVSS